MLQQFLPEPDIIPEQLEDLVAAGDPGKDPLRVRVEKIFRRQVCGNDRGFLAHEPLIDEQEQLRGDEGVHHLRAQIINDEQVTVEDVIPEIIVLFFTGKAVPGKPVKQLPGGKNRGPEKERSRSSLAMQLVRKVLPVPVLPYRNRFGCVWEKSSMNRWASASAVWARRREERPVPGIDHVFRIVVFPEMGKILPFQHLPQVGLVVQQVDLRLPEAVTFLPADITGILTVRADIVRFQIICRKTVFGQKVIPLLTKSMKPVGAAAGLSGLVVQHEAGTAGLERGNLCLQIRECRDRVIDGLLPLLLAETVVRLPVCCKCA